VDPQALYYTLSTIAQTLAGALAILVAVVLFKLTGLAQTIERGKDEMRALNLDMATAWPILRDHGYEPFAVSQSKVLNPSPGMRGGWEATHSAYKTWGGINRRLYTVLGFSVAAIILCFVALPFTARIACSGWLSLVTMSSAVGLGTISLGLYVWLIVAMVRRPV
jgi:hypothetical protein